MKRALKFTVLAIVNLIFFIQSTLAVAGLSDSLSGMWQSTATPPGVYSSQTRLGFVGGSMTLRQPSKSYQVIRFDAPRLNAGCSGIDLYGGAFSFISGDQLKELIRKIASSAVSYFFQLALTSGCQICNSVLNGLQNLSTMVNSANLNACKTGQDFGKFLFDSMGADAQKGAAEATAEKTETSKGNARDWVTSFWNMFTAPATTRYSSRDANPYVGNLTWRALVTSKAIQSVGDPMTGSGTSDIQVAQLIMSLMGTSILKADGSGGTGCSGSNCDTKADVKKPLLTLRDLLDGADITQAEANAGTTTSKKMWYQCTTNAIISDEYSCQDVTTTPFTFIGTRGYVNNMLFGSIDGSVIGTDSIVGRVIAGQTLLPEQQGFISAFSMPVYTAMLEVQAVPNAVQMVAYSVRRSMAEEMAVLLGRALLQTTALAFSGAKEAAMPQLIESSMRNLRTEIAAMSTNSTDNMQEINELAALIANIRKYNPSYLFTTGPGR